jgi:hypothetical protein
MKEYFENNNLLAPAVFFGICFVVFGLILGSSIKSFANKDESITVTGTAEKFVVSDIAKWTISVSERAYGDGAGISASRMSQKSIDSIKNFLIKNGVEESEITVNTSSLSPICELSPQGYENCSIGIKGQVANQNIIVDSIFFGLVRITLPRTLSP